MVDHIQTSYTEPGFAATFNIFHTSNTSVKGIVSLYRLWHAAMVVLK
jgi:hypothetical protein